MRLSEMTWVEVERYLRKNLGVILPVGSSEQHGPSGPIGTDYLCAEAVALEVGKRLSLVVAPVLPYGMSSHHMAFPGSMTIRPSIYQDFLGEIFRSLYRSGFRKFCVVNGHGGNEFSVRAVFQELMHDDRTCPALEGASFEFFNWWRLPSVATRARELFGDREGSHATPSELSLAMSLLGGTEPRAYQAVQGVGEKHWPLSPDEMRRVFPDGVMGADPGLARAEHGARFLDLAARDICEALGGRK